MTPSQRLSLLGASGALFVGFVIWAMTRPIAERPAPIPAAIAASEPAPAVVSTDPAATMPPGETAPATQTAPHPEASVTRITPGELRELIARNEAVVVDVRTIDAFQKRRIPGAIHLPGNTIAMNLDRLPRDKRIVTYCT